MKYIKFFIILNMCVVTTYSMDTKKRGKGYSKLLKKSKTVQNSKRKNKTKVLRSKPMCGPYIDAGGKVDCECILY